MYMLTTGTVHLSDITFFRNLFSPVQTSSSSPREQWLKLSLYGFINGGLSLLLLFGHMWDFRHLLWAMNLVDKWGGSLGQDCTEAFSFSCLSPLPCPQHNPVQAFASSLNPLCAAPEAKSASNSISLYYLQWGKIMELSVLAWIVSSWLVALKLCGNCRLKTKS